MDGAFYNDLRSPFMTADVGAVTLASTDKALYPAANFPVLGGNYWYLGKTIKISLFGRMTTGATPGNGTWDVYWGTGADANGTVIQASAAVALVANGSTLPWYAEFIIRCTAIGSSGTLFCTGYSLFNVGLILSTAAPVLIPATAPATSGTIDLTAANIVSVQYKRSGSTAETMQIHNMQVIALN
jgi:hypothetical protein